MRSAPWRVLALVVLGGASLLRPVPGAAQWIVEAQAGRLISAPGAAAASQGALALGLRYDHRQGGVRFGAGVPASGEEPLWGSAGGWYRLARERGAVSAGVDLSAQGALLRGRASSFRRVPGFPFDRDEVVPPTSASTLGGQILPFMAYDRGRVRVQARAGVAHVTIIQGETQVDRTLPLGDLQLTVFPSHAFAVAPTLRRFREPDGTLTDYAGVTAVAAHSMVTVAASVGQWFGRADLETPWSASVTLWPQGRVHVTAGARRDTYDPLTLHPAQTSWNLAVGMKLGRLARPIAPPLASVGADGRAQIRLPVKDVREPPRIAGNFNDWTPVAMTRDGAHWVYSVPLAAGVYQYAFVSPNGTWFVPPDTPGRRDDGMGGHVAVLIVR